MSVASTLSAAARDTSGANNPLVVAADRPALVMMRHGRTLLPAGPLDIEALAKFSPTRPIDVHLSQERHTGQHRLYWALLTVVAQNLDPSVFPDELHVWVKRNCGASILDHKTGENFDLVAASTAFEAMDQPGFHDFFERVVDLLVTRIIPGLSRESLRREAVALIGFAA